MLGRFNNSQTTIIKYKVILARSRIYVISIEVVGSFKLTLSKKKKIVNHCHHFLERSLQIWDLFQSAWVPFCKCGLGLMTHSGATNATILEMYTN